MDEILDAAERFVQSIRAEETEINRVLATVLFTDIVGKALHLRALPRWGGGLRHAGWSPRRDRAGAPSPRQRRRSGRACRGVKLRIRHVAEVDRVLEPLADLA